MDEHEAGRTKAHWSNGHTGTRSPVTGERRPAATISVDLDPVDVHLRGYGHIGLSPDPLVHDVALPRLLESFDRHRVRATFFVLAREVAPELRRLAEIAAAGHEVASHGVDHVRGISTRTATEIRTELERSRARIELASNCPVVGFRAPDWSAGLRLVTALDETGYRYDASLVPSPALTAGRLLLAARARRLRDVAAVRLPPSLRRLPFRWAAGDHSIIEFPLAVSPRLRIPLYHTIRPNLSDERFDRHLDGFVRRGESLSYALHGVDALGLAEDVVDGRLGVHPGMAATLEAKLALLDRTVAAIASRFDVRPFAERLAPYTDADVIR